MENIAVIGAGPLGTVPAAALHAPPLARGTDAGGADLVLLCVPDAQIADALADAARQLAGTGAGAAR